MFDEQPEPTEAEVESYRRHVEAVERVCRAICAVEGLDPDGGEYTEGPNWTRYSTAVNDVLVDYLISST